MEVADDRHDSRLTLLAEIKAHSQQLTEENGADGDGARIPGDATAGLGEAGGWSDAEWRGAFQQLFLAKRPASTEGCTGGGQDDLLFFVRPEGCQNARGGGSQGDTSSWAALGLGALRRGMGGGGDGADHGTRVFVRRWRPDIPEDVGPIDWRETLFLNVIGHTSFLLTIAVCSRRDLIDTDGGGDGSRGQSPRPISRIVKEVYATPSRSAVSFSSEYSGGAGGSGAGAGKAASHDPTYPNLYFSVDDFADAFEDTVISDPDHCLCVHLSATDSVAFQESMGWGGGQGGGGRAGDGSSTDPTAAEGDEKRRVGTQNRRWGREGKPQQLRRVTLFAGFVSYEQLRGALSSVQRGGGALSALSSRLGRTGGAGSRGGGGGRPPERIVMAGPGGRGQAEVAVFETLNAPDPISTYGSSGSTERGRGVQPSSRGVRGGGGLLMPLATSMGRALLSAGSAALRGMGGGSGAERPGGGGVEIAPKLQCCIMSVCMRWDLIAHDILFKPPSLLDVK